MCVHTTLISAGAGVAPFTKVPFSSVGDWEGGGGGWDPIDKPALSALAFGS